MPSTKCLWKLGPVYLKDLTTFEPVVVNRTAGVVGRPVWNWCATCGSCPQYMPCNDVCGWCLHTAVPWMHVTIHTLGCKAHPCKEKWLNERQNKG